MYVPLKTEKKNILLFRLIRKDLFNYYFLKHLTWVNIRYPLKSRPHLGKLCEMRRKTSERVKWTKNNLIQFPVRNTDIIEISNFPQPVVALLCSRTKMRKQISFSEKWNKIGCWKRKGEKQKWNFQTQPWLRANAGNELRYLCYHTARMPGGRGEENQITFLRVHCWSSPVLL